MRHISEPWGRVPDERRSYRRGQEEALWINGDRCVSVFVSKRGIELALMYRVFIDGKPDWATSADGIYDGKDVKVRTEAWAWLDGGPWPTTKAS